MNSWIPKSNIVKFAATSALLSIALYVIGLFIVLGGIKNVKEFYQNNDSEALIKAKSFAISSTVEANKESVQTLRNFFIKKGDEVKFIEQIEEVARESGIKFEIISIDVKASQTDPVKEDVNVKIKAESSWGNIMLFLEKLERMPFGVLVGNMGLNVDVPGNWSGMVEFIVFREK